MQEMADPSLSLDRSRATWQKHGYSEKWIQQRMMGQETRNKLTDYWQEHGIEQPKEFAILTSIIHQEWAGISVKDHKEAKGLKSQNFHFPLPNPRPAKRHYHTSQIPGAGEGANRSNLKNMGPN